MMFLLVEPLLWIDPTLPKVTRRILKDLLYSRFHIDSAMNIY